MEFLIVTIVTTILFMNHFKVHPAFGLLFGIAIIVSLYGLFFTTRIFRYIFSILFAFGWAVGAFAAGELLDKKSDTTGWVFALIAFVISIWAHWRYYTFTKKADVYEYE